MRTSLALLLMIVPMLGGCATAHQGVRYVYQDGEFGVVGIPENTDRWPTHYRTQAEKLMAAHFPEGHEIVRAEEVVDGSRTMKVEGSRSAELAPQLPAALITAAKLGGTASKSVLDTTTLKECRIIYRRAMRPDYAAAFADEPGLNPTEYIDPNEAARSKAAAPIAEARSSEPAKAPIQGG